MQRKFREVDEEEAYFDCDDGEDMEETQNTSTTDSENDLHRTPRMFSLSEQASSLETHGTGTDNSEKKSEEETKTDKGDDAEVGDKAAAAKAEEGKSTDGATT